jgi:hypothetical protein
LRGGDGTRAQSESDSKDKSMGFSLTTLLAERFDDEGIVFAGQDIGE